MAQLVLVDDDRSVLTSVSALLENEGHTVRSFTDPKRALQTINRSKPDLAVLDVQMPDIDGFEVLRRIRETSNLPVMFLSGESSDVDEAMGLRLGADDYMQKPYSPRVLVERVRACLRRKPEAVSVPTGEGAALTRGALHMDRDCHLVTWNDHPVQLTVTEFNVLWIIAQRPNVVFSRSKVLDIAYGDDIYVTDRSIDSQIKRIRLKLRKVDPTFDSIETLYGLGYRYVMTPNEAKH
ncbi:response regulator transcription factor [Shimia sp.]|uniref:response regulator transcription factor n=1 Tax=Shimia sp. TaxID=1954381 RepID=UPI003296C834